jgi:hypothetical protein
MKLQQKPVVMRTTLNLNADIMSAARQIASAKSRSIGEVISELARRGLEARNGASPLTPEDVRQDEDFAKSKP